MNSVIERLNEMTEEVNDAKTGAARSDGVLSELRKTLKDSFELKTVSSAEKEISKLTEERETKGQLLTEKMEILEEAYDWD